MRNFEFFSFFHQNDENQASGLVTKSVEPPARRWGWDIEIFENRAEIFQIFQKINFGCFKTAGPLGPRSGRGNIARSVLETFPSPQSAQGQRTDIIF